MILEKPEFHYTNSSLIYDCSCANDRNAEKGSDDSQSKEGHSSTSRGDGKQNPASR
jgi:hypothetical protein